MKRMRNIKLFDWAKTKYWNLINGVHNIFDWFNIVWKDRDWEYDHFTMKFIYHKLKRLQKRPWHTVFEDGEWWERYRDLCIWLIEEEQRMENLEDDLWKSCEQANTWIDDKPNKDGHYEMHWEWSSPVAEKHYHDVQEKRYIRQKKIHHLIYYILETRGSGMWD
jgi:hypothetical protein